MTFLSGALAILLVLFNGPLNAQKNNFYRDYWMPKYHGKRLNYCSLGGKQCGLAIATLYCRLMGYKYADKQVIDNNVGLTNYFACNLSCKGLRCNGFKIIRCVSNFSPTPPKVYHYRLRRFVFPLFNHCRLDWCYDGRQECGYKAAFSFCRQMGYLSVRRFSIQNKIAATKAIGNQKLCFGLECKAFKFIDCYR